jgi:hypothetical protein
MNSVLKTRAKLSVEQVIEIFNIKSTMPNNAAASIARQYRVSEKTVRDIWSGRTWCGETWHLDTARVIAPKSIGRPKGCRDSKPRKAKTEGDTICRMAPNDASALDEQRPIGAEITSLESGQVHKAYSTTVITPMDLKYDISMAQVMSASFHPLQALSSSQPPPASSAAHSVDQQLHEWGQALWLDLEAADPFRKDWNPWQEEASFPAGAPARK